ncbi:MAG: hypothetical protein ACE5DI_02750 [Candidatus Micrarchaeia archaeon]
MDFSKSESYSFNELNIKVRTATNYLIESKGFPPDWNANNVQTMGLSAQRGVIDQTRLAEFLNLSVSNQERSRELLGLGSVSTYFKLYYTNGTTVFVDAPPTFQGNASFGGTTGNKIVSNKRLAVYKNNRVFLQLDVGK